MEAHSPSELPRPLDARLSELRDLDAIFAPRAVAVLGASDSRAVALAVLSNLVGHPFGGTVYPIDPVEKSLLGIKAYPRLAAVPDRIDLAVITNPAPDVPRLIGECVDAGVRGAIILSPGFRETGPGGARLEDQVLEQARRGSLRLIGPNCLGVINTANGLNATYARHMPRRGHVAFLSQSGALGTAVLDWALREEVGLSTFVSVGSMLDIGWGELIYYLADDPQTRSILIYMETLGDARSFISATREVALSKPIIVLKAGRTEGAARAAVSHTGALTGSDAVLDAAVRRVGALRVQSLADLFHMADVLDKQPRPLGPRLLIITNAGGPGVMAADALVAHGGELAPLSAETLAALGHLLPPQWSHTNPIDLLDDASPERYRQTLEIAAKEPSANGFLVVLAPQACSDPLGTAEQLKPFAQRLGKPLLASWMGARRVEAGEAALNRARIPAFPYPDMAARMFDYMWRYTYNLRGIYETPALPSGAEEQLDRTRAENIIAAARREGRTLLSEYESKQVLAAYNLPVVDTRLATGEDEAVRCADELGYPVVVKINSTTIAHKMDIGGVELDLPDAAAVRAAFRRIRERGGAHFQGVTVQPMVTGAGYELIAGSSTDALFGPILLFGAGGVLTESLRDQSLALPPLNTTLARRMMEQTRIYSALKDMRAGSAIDFDALEQFMVRLSQLVVEQRWIREMDINPLYALALSPRPARGAGNHALVALDARIAVYPAEFRQEDVPPMAIRPYPAQYVGRWTTAQGIPVLIRPIRPEDEPLMVRFHETLSERSVFMRYMHMLPLSQRIAHDRLARVCFNDYDRELALVAERQDASSGIREIIAVGRLSKLRRRKDAEFAILISDQYQGHGLGTELLRRLVQVARDEKMDRVIGFIASENTAMLRVCKKLGFQLRRPPLDETEVEAVLDLHP